jgi:hypothetical protein
MDLLSDNTMGSETTCEEDDAVELEQHADDDSEEDDLPCKRDNEESVSELERGEDESARREEVTEASSDLSKGLRPHIAAEAEMEMSRAGIGEEASPEQDLAADLLTEDVLDGFFENGASCELLGSWTKIEATVWSGKTSDEIIPSPVRSVVLQFMRCVSIDLRLLPEAWYEMVAMFELYLNRTSRDDLLESLPLCSSVIIRLIAKFDSQFAYCSDVDALLCMEAPKLGGWLVSHGYIASQPSLDTKQIDDMEKEVLSILEWRLTLPTSLTWSRSFLVRFSMLTQQRYKASLQWLWVQTSTQLDYFIQEGLAPHLTPQQLAIGLFVLGLASANLIPMNAIFGEEDEEIRQAFLACQQTGAAVLEDASHGPLKLFSKLLEISTTVPMISIRHYCHDIAKMVAHLGRRR